MIRHWALGPSPFQASSWPQHCESELSDPAEQDDSLSIALPQETLRPLILPERSCVLVIRLVFSRPFLHPMAYA